MVKDVLGTEEASKVFGVILACNLHFHMPEKNYVMDALVEVKQVDFFFEEMFFLHSIRGKDRSYDVKRRWNSKRRWCRQLLCTNGLDLCVQDVQGSRSWPPIDV